MLPMLPGGQMSINLTDISTSRSKSSCSTNNNIIEMVWQDWCAYVQFDQNENGDWYIGSSHRDSMC